jgi:hypothetical protein
VLYFAASISSLIENSGFQAEQCGGTNGGISLVKSEIIAAHPYHSLKWASTMTGKRTFFKRIRDKFSRNVTPPHPSPQTSDVTHIASNSPSTARTNRPSTRHLPPSPNLLSHRDEHIEEATSSVPLGIVNNVGRDQINNTTNYIYMNPDLSAGTSSSQHRRYVHRPNLTLQKKPRFYLYVVFDL